MFWLRRGGLLAVFTFLLPCASLAQEDAPLREGRAALQRGDYAEAIRQFSQVTRLQPRNADAHFLRALAYGGLGAGEASEREALADFDAAIHLNPGEASYYDARGFYYHVHGRYDDAIRDFSAAIHLQPRVATYYVNRASTYRSKQEYDRAIADYTKSFELRPQTYDALALRGDVYAQKGEYAKAIADYDTAIRQQPDNANYYVGRARVHARSGNDHQALADFTRGMAHKPDRVTLVLLYLGRGDSHRRTKDYLRSRADYEAALRLAPRNALVQNQLAWLLATCPNARMRDGPRAVGLARQACERSAWRKPEFLSTLACAYAETGNFREAARWQKKALEVPTAAKASAQLDRDRLTLFEKGKPFRDERQ